jgi:hypothetical protein
MIGDSKFHIVYPCGDRSRLSVVEIVPALEYELNDYAVASRKHFYSESKANEYARELAEKYNLTFEAEGYLD